MDTLPAAEVIAKRAAEAAILAPAAPDLERLSISAELTYGEPTSNTALYIDLDGPAAMGRMTWWSDGSLVAEVLRLSDGESLLSQHTTASTATEAALALRSLAEVVAGCASDGAP